jgi:hypothetical protein
MHVALRNPRAVDVSADMIMAPATAAKGALQTTQGPVFRNARDVLNHDGAKDPPCAVARAPRPRSNSHKHGRGAHATKDGFRMQKMNPSSFVSLRVHSWTTILLGPVLCAFRELCGGHTHSSTGCADFTDGIQRFRIGIGKVQTIWHPRRCHPDARKHIATRVTDRGRRKTRDARVTFSVIAVHRDSITCNSPLRGFHIPCPPRGLRFAIFSIVAPRCAVMRAARRPKCTPAAAPAAHLPHTIPPHSFPPKSAGDIQNIRRGHSEYPRAASQSRTRRDRIFWMSPFPILSHTRLSRAYTVSGNPSALHREGRDRSLFGRHVDRGDS